MAEQPLTVVHLLGGGVLVSALILALRRGSRARADLLRRYRIAFRWSRFQRKTSLLLAVPLAAGVFSLPYIFSTVRLGNPLDVAALLAVMAGFLLGIAEVINRHSTLDDTSVAGISWSGRMKSTPWHDVTRVSYHDFYGGFFLVHSPTATIFLPVQADRPLAMIAALESFAPTSALASARKGIALCKGAFAG